MNGLSAAGFIAEYMSGERAQSLPHTVPHQLFSSSAVINPLVTGMLGMEGDALEGTLMVRPHIPQEWKVEFDNYRVGESNVSGTIARVRGETRVSLSITGKQLRVTFSPAFAAGGAPALACAMISRTVIGRAGSGAAAGRAGGAGRWGSFAGAFTRSNSRGLKS